VNRADGNSCFSLLVLSLMSLLSADLVLVTVPSVPIDFDLSQTLHQSVASAKDSAQLSPIEVSRENLSLFLLHPRHLSVSSSDTFLGECHRRLGSNQSHSSAGKKPMTEDVAKEFDNIFFRFRFNRLRCVTTSGEMSRKELPPSFPFSLTPVKQKSLT
jgi:hypothetical protein